MSVIKPYFVFQSFQLQKLSIERQLDLPQVAQVVSSEVRVRVPTQFILYPSPEPIATGYLTFARFKAKPTQLPTHHLHLRPDPELMAPHPQATFRVTSWGWSQSCDRETKKDWAQRE